MKKTLIMILTVLMLFSLISGCGSKKAEQPAAEQSQEQTADAPEEEAAPEEPEGEAAEQPAAEGGAIITGYTDEDIEGAFIAVCTLDMTDEWLAYQANGVADYYTERGARVEVSGCQFDTALQIQQMENYAAMGVDQIVCWPVSWREIEDTCNSIRALGIQIMLVGVDPTEGFIADCFRNCDSPLAGKVIGTAALAWLDEVYPDAEDGSVHVAAYTMTTVETNKQRGESMIATLEADPRVTVTFVKDNVITAEDGVTATEEALAADPDIKLFMCWTDAVGVGVNTVITRENEDVSSFGVFGVGYSESSEQLIEIAGEGGNSCYRALLQLGALDAVLDTWTDSYLTLTNQVECPYVHYDAFEMFSSYGYVIPEEWADGTE